MSFEKTTRGIKISVRPLFKESFYSENQLFHVFNYTVNIENNSNQTVQLLSRSWAIIDALNVTSYINGPGVIGETPILEPNTRHNYTSHCMLISAIGVMKGNYTMLNKDSGEEFTVEIPTFQLIGNGTFN